MNGVERRILVVTSFGHFLSHYNMLVFPSIVLPLAAHLQLERAEVLGLSFWMYLLFGVTALPWGMLGDKCGGKRLMVLMFAGAGLSGLAAAALSGSPLGITLSLAGVGLFSGIYHPIGLGLVSKGVERLSVAMGYNAIFGSLGLGMAPLVTGVLNWFFGPVSAFVALGVLNLTGLVLMAMLPLKESAAVPRRSAGGDNGSLSPFLILLVANMLGGIAYTGATVILPSFMELNTPGIFQAISGLVGQGLSNNLLATTIVGAVYIVGMWGQYVGGHVGERCETRYSYLIFHLVCIPAAMLMGLAQDVPLVAASFLYFFFLLGMQPIENTLVANFAPARLHHSAFGMKFILTFGVGAVAVKMVQWIDAGWGLRAVFPAMAGISVLLVFVILLLIRQTSPRNAEGQEAAAET